MGNGTSRVVGCFVPFNDKNDVDLEFLAPLDEGLGHSFCYVRPSIFDSPAITPSNSERFTVDSSTVDSETLSGSFRQDVVDDPSGLHRLNRNFPETTFKTISGASVSANVSTARSGNQSALLASEVQEPAASFESTASFAAIPLQPVPRGSGPLNGFMSGPLERGLASGPLERGVGFMSGPIEKGVMSGPLDAADKSNFSAPLVRSRRRPRFQRFMRSVSGPMKSTLSRTFSKHSLGSGWMNKLFFHPVNQLAWHLREPKFQQEPSRNSFEGVPSEGAYVNGRNLQWAHGKAGEDRIHVVLSEEQGWLFIGIYDGFSGPDAPDFLMSNLYRAIDKELEGLLWDYEDKSLPEPVKPEESKFEISEKCLDPNTSQVSSCSLENPCDPGIPEGQSSTCEIAEENEDVRNSQQQPLTGISILEPAPCSAPSTSLSGQGKKSVRLYELLQLETDGISSLSISIIENQRKSSLNCEQISTSLYPRESLEEEQLRSSALKNCKGDRLDFPGDNPTTSGQNLEAVCDSSSQGVLTDKFVPLQKHNTRKSNLGSKIKRMYRKQRSLRKKLFPWSYDWHRDDTCIEEQVVEPRPIRRCKSGIVDHDAVLRALSRALEHTEEAYMELVEKALDKNPELALMGSCVLVMLMKDQDVYVVNLGDSRVILAQERPSDRHPNQNFAKDDLRTRTKSRESLVRMELDRISEESPLHNQNSQVNMINKNREISICRMKMRAVQLSSDHCTSIEEEVLRIKAEHPDDDQAILNDRVKGQLKVTRAFGAGFLKKPICNDALLEIFQVDYVGMVPYVSCIPSVCHHRLSSCDRFLVLSSDGLYQYFSNEEVVAHVAWFMENVPEGDPAQYLIAELLFRAAKKNGMDFHELLDIPHGDRRKYHDDVSVMVVSLEGRIWRSSG